MQLLQIDEFDAKFQLPRSMWDERHRLDHVLQMMLHSRLETELERAGVVASDEICIREIRFPVRLSLSHTDNQLASTWAEAFARSVVAALASAESHFAVRYSSMLAALIDFAASVAQGDLRHAWAWRQLFFAGRGPLANVQDVAERLVAVLCSPPQSIVAVLREISRRGLLAKLFAQLGEGHFESLAIAVLKLHGFSATQWQQLKEAVCNSLPDKRSVSRLATSQVDGDSLQLDLAVARSLRQSPLSGAIAELVSPALSPTQQTALAVFATMDADPALISSDLPIAVRAITATVWSFFHGKADHVAISSHGEPTLESDLGVTESDEAPAPNLEIRDKPEVTTESESRASAPEHEVDSSTKETNQDASSERDDTGSRRGARTNFGGLLYLIHVVHELDLPRQILSWPPFAPRSVRWTLHQLALSLAAADPGDAAALAFAGLPPDALPPSRRESRASVEEREQIAVWRNAVIHRARQRLNDFERLSRPNASPNSELTGLPDESLIDWLCRRPAEIVADPGWLEVRFGLQNVSTEIRGAGLDLDPGYVPWLGVVVKFVYE